MTDKSHMPTRILSLIADFYRSSKRPNYILISKDWRDLLEQQLPPSAYSMTRLALLAATEKLNDLDTTLYGLKIIVIQGSERLELA